MITQDGVCNMVFLGCPKERWLHKPLSEKCLLKNWGNILAVDLLWLTPTFLDTYLFQIYACATFSSAKQSQLATGKVCLKLKKTKWTPQQCLDGAGSRKMGIPAGAHGIRCEAGECGWKGPLHQPPSARCQQFSTRNLIDSDTFFFLHVFWPLKNTVCFWFGSLATASLRGSSCVLCFFFSFDLPYSTWYDICIYVYMII